MPSQYSSDARLVERFWVKVTRAGDDECWLWTGGTAGRGYGTFRVGSKMAYAHRISYDLAFGPIADGLDIDHLCGTPPCVNPRHLEAVTHRENVLRGDTVPAAHAGKTTCPKGHPYDLFNTYTPPRGGRQCRQCKRAADRSFRERRRRP